MKLLTLFNMQTSLNRVVALELEPKTSYRVSKILRKVIAELKTVEDERQKLIKKYAVADDKGIKKVPDDKMEEFNKDWASLLEMEVKMDIELIPLDMLEGVKLSAKEMMDLDEIIDLTSLA